MKLKERPYLVVDAFIKKGNKYLAIKRAKERFVEVNSWEVPGGRVDYGEKIEDALKREIKEELNVNIKINKFLGWGEALSPHKKGFEVHRLILYFDCEIISGELKFDEKEISDHKWLTWEEFKNLKSLSKAIKDFFKKSG